MEELNKTQIILLTLLVSFVTSIATGITTVTLMDQAPPAITQTLNRIVERTVERVIQPASVVTKEVKVVVKEEDAVVSAFEKNRHSVIRVEKNGADGGFVALGTIIRDDGIIAIPDKIISARGEYHVFINGALIPIVFATTTQNGGLSLFYIKTESETTQTDEQKEISVAEEGIFQSVKRAVGIEEQKENTRFVSVRFASSDIVRPGQTAIAIGGKEGDKIFTGIISRVEKEELESEKNASTTDSILPLPVKNVIALYTDIDFEEDSDGGVLLNLDGDAIGIIVSGQNEMFAVPSDIIQEALERI